MTRSEVIQEVLNRKQSSKQIYTMSLLYGSDLDHINKRKEMDFWDSLTLLIQTQLKKPRGVK